MMKAIGRLGSYHDIGVVRYYLGDMGIFNCVSTVAHIKTPTSCAEKYANSSAYETNVICSVGTRPQDLRVYLNWFRIKHHEPI